MTDKENVIISEEITLPPLKVPVIIQECGVKRYYRQYSPRMNDLEYTLYTDTGRHDFSYRLPDEYTQEEFDEHHARALESIAGILKSEESND